MCVCDTLTGLRLGDMVSSSSGSMYVDRDPTSKVCLTAGDTSVNKVRISCLYRCNCCWAYDCSVRFYILVSKFVLYLKMAIRIADMRRGG